MNAGRPIRHRLFSRCVVCDRDIACWEDNDWWHMDNDFIIDHRAFPKEDEMAENTNPMQGFYGYTVALVGEKGERLTARVCMDCGGVVADNQRDQHNGWHKRMGDPAPHYHETFDSAEYTGSAIPAIVPGKEDAYPAAEAPDA